MTFPSTILLSRVDKLKIAEIYNGIPVLEITPNSLSEKVGILPGDVIIRVNGMNTNDFESYSKARNINVTNTTIDYVRMGVEHSVVL